MSSFKDLRIVDNFYQTSLFFPMPTVLIGTLCDDGKTSLGPYSLVQPYYVAGKDYYAMLLNCRNSSNTAQHILKTGKCTINFVKDDRKTFKEVVRLGWPGDTPEEKMKDCKFTLEEGLMASEHPGEKFPMVVADAFQAIECTWMRELDGADRDPARGQDFDEGKVLQRDHQWREVPRFPACAGRLRLPRQQEFLVHPPQPRDSGAAADAPDNGFERYVRGGAHRPGGQVHRRGLRAPGEGAAHFPADCAEGLR